MKLKEETIIKLDELQEVYNKQAYKIILDEAKRNNPYKVGDILQDHYQIGKINRIVIKINVIHRIYELSYSCDRLNKKLHDYRGGEITTIYLQNVEKQITK